MMDEWGHIFKLDPAKKISVENLERVCTSGTDAIIIGGTDNITFTGTIDLLTRVGQYDLPVISEVSSMDAIIPGFDYYFIPMVMNSTEKKWMMDIQHEALKIFHHLIDWEQIYIEGYCILNEASKAYKKTNCQLPDEEDVKAYAAMAEHMFKMPIFYVEYSGMYGDPLLIEKVKQQLNNTLLFYGGGIATKEQAIEMKAHSDVIIVGNSLYTDLESALETVEAAKQMK